MNKVSIGPLDVLEAKSLIEQLIKEQIDFEVKQAQSFFKQNNIGIGTSEDPILNNLAIEVNESDFIDYKNIFESFGFQKLENKIQPFELQQLNDTSSSGKKTSNVDLALNVTYILFIFLVLLETILKRNDGVFKGIQIFLILILVGLGLYKKRKK